MIALRTVIATAVIGLGILLSVNTTATAEYDAFAALKAYDSADPANRKVWELIFGNTQNGINWANAVLIQRKQQPLYCARGQTANPQVSRISSCKASLV